MLGITGGPRNYDTGSSSKASNFTALTDRVLAFLLVTASRSRLSGCGVNRMRAHDR
jgi:hypothetical protein